jgi:4-amino-4-deoxy-L-arabinose transferase-like glycosyltransferase
MTLAEAAAGERHVRVSRREAGVLLTIAAIGLMLRTWHLGTAGTDHFDEGVYLLRALDLSSSDQSVPPYPGGDHFSPPVHVAMIAVAYRLMGAPSDVAAAAVSVFFGVACIIALWWLGRSWFGPAVGIAAAALLAVDEYHVALSRSALTDVTFGFFFLVALGLIVRAIERGGIARAVLAGLAVGVAWNTKYHGWFAVPIAAAGLAAWAASSHRQWSSLARRAMILFFVALVAALLYLPWALHINSEPGGYAALTAIHRSFISLNWGGHLLEQLRYQQLLDGPWRRAAPFVALLSISALRGPAGLSARQAGALVGLAGVSLAAGSLASLALLATIGLIVRFRRGNQEYGEWLAAAFAATFLVATFLYHPYARLLLPLVLATALWAGKALESTVLPERSTAKSWRAGIFCACLGVIVFVGSFWRSEPASPWHRADGMKRAAGAIAAQLPPRARVVVIAEPSLQFYLYTFGRPSFERVRNVDELAKTREPLYIVTGVYARRAPVMRQGLERLRPQLERVATYMVFPKDLRVLDDFSAAKARAWLLQPDSTYVLTLFRLLPATESSPTVTTTDQGVPTSKRALFAEL